MLGATFPQFGILEMRVERISCTIDSLLGMEYSDWSLAHSKNKWDSRIKDDLNETQEKKKKAVGSDPYGLQILEDPSFKRMITFFSKIANTTGNYH